MFHYNYNRQFLTPAIYRRRVRRDDFLCSRHSISHESFLGFFAFWFHPVVHVSFQFLSDSSIQPVKLFPVYSASLLLGCAFFFHQFYSSPDGLSIYCMLSRLCRWLPFLFRLYV